MSKTKTLHTVLEDEHYKLTACGNFKMKSPDIFIDPYHEMLERNSFRIDFMKLLIEDYIKLKNKE